MEEIRRKFTEVGEKQKLLTALLEENGKNKTESMRKLERGNKIR